MKTLFITGTVFATLGIFALAGGKTEAGGTGVTLGVALWVAWAIACVAKWIDGEDDATG